MAQLGVDQVGERLQDVGEFVSDEPLRTDRRGDELDANRCPDSTIAGAQLGDRGEVDVAGEHHNVGHRCIGQVLENPLALQRIAVPLVVVQYGLAERCVREHNLVADRVPHRCRRVQHLVQPRLLIVAQHCARGARDLGARRVDAQCHVPARLIGAVLAAIEQRQVHQLAPVHDAVDTVLLVGDRWVEANRLVLPPCLIRSKAAIGKGSCIGLSLRHQAGVVVLDLVIVPDHEPWTHGVRCL